MDSDGPALDPSTAILAKSTCRYLDNRSEESMDQKGPGHLWYLLFKKKKNKKKEEEKESHLVQIKYPIDIFLCTFIC